MADFEFTFTDKSYEWRKNEIAKSYGSHWDIFAVITKYKTGDYRETYSSVESLSIEQAKKLVDYSPITEVSVWTVNKDGSLDDKLCTFFRRIKADIAKKDINEVSISDYNGHRTST